MKKVRLITAASLFALGMVTLTSCGGGEEDASTDENGTEQTDENAGGDEKKGDEKEEKSLSESKMYQCPDNCDEGRAFFSEGDCKKCGKEMVEI